MTGKYYNRTTHYLNWRYFVSETTHYRHGQQESKLYI